jgi:hypothetical protein
MEDSIYFDEGRARMASSSKKGITSSRSADSMFFLWESRIKGVSSSLQVGTFCGVEKDSFFTIYLDYPSRSSP